MVFAFWSIQIYYFIQTHLTYSNISYFFYVSYIFTIVALPLVIMVVSRVLLGFILMICNNQELIKTVKWILEVFPEGIIIQSIEKDSNKLTLQFSNDTANNEILGFKSSIGKPIQDQYLDFTIKVNDVQNKNYSSKSIKQQNSSLSELLETHAHTVLRGEAETSNSLEIKRK